MALNPEIALGVRPPVLQPLQIQSPLERFGKVLTLRNLMQNQQLGQMNVEQTRLENEALRRTAQDEQTLGSWMKQNQRPDLTASEIVAAHPNPTGLKVATAWSAQQTAALTQRKAVLDAAHEEAKTDDRIYNSVTDDQSKLAALTELVRLKRIDGTQASHLAAIPFDSPEFKGIQQRVAAGSMDRVQRIEAAKKEIELRIAQATEGSTTKGAIAEGEKKTLDAANAQKASDASTLAAAAARGPDALNTALAALPVERRTPFLGVTTPLDIVKRALTAEQFVTDARQRENAERQAIPNTPTELAVWMTDPKRTPEEKAAGQAAMKELERHAAASRPVINTSIPGMPIGGGANQTTGEEYLKTLPASIGAQVKAIAEGRSGIPSAQSRSQTAQQIRDAVFRYDPTFSEQRAQVRKNFTTGPDGRNIGALNTAIVHLGRLGDTAEGLQNGNFTPGNEAYNWLRDKFGSETVTNFGLLKDAVAGEMAAALKGNATDIEIEKMGKSIRAANSPAQMRGVIQEGMAILNDKATTYNERYHREMPDDPWSPILPSAKAQLDRHGVKKSEDKGAITVTDPRGVVHKFATQKQADDFKRAAGIK